MACHQMSSHFLNSVIGIVVLKNLKNIHLLLFKLRGGANVYITTGGGGNVCSVRVHTEHCRSGKTGDALRRAQGKLLVATSLAVSGDMNDCLAAWIKTSRRYGCAVPTQGTPLYPALHRSGSW